MKWTTAIITAAVVPTLALAQDPTYGRDTARAQGRDTARAQPQQRDRARGEPRVRSESRGDVAPRRGARGRTTWGLSMTQIRELQQGLQNIDCYDGEIDGLIGPRTRAGIACAMRHHDITGEDPNELMRALNVDIEVDAKAGLGAVMRSGAARGEPRDMQRNRQRDTSGQRNQRDTLQGNRPTTTPTPQNVPPR
jgi:hypothetical protein